MLGPALPREAGTKAGPAASKARSRPQSQTLCQDRRKEDCRISLRTLKNRKPNGQETCPTSHGKMVANWDTAPIPPSQPCPVAKCLLLPLAKRQGHHTCPACVWLRHQGSLRPFLHTILLHATHWSFTGRQLTSMTQYLSLFS